MLLRYCIRPSTSIAVNRLSCFSNSKGIALNNRLGVAYAHESSYRLCRPKKTKLKSHSGAKKRFKVRKDGSVTRGTAGAHHNMWKISSNRRFRKKKQKFVHHTMVKKIRQMLLKKQRYKPVKKRGISRLVSSLQQ